MLSSLLLHGFKISVTDTPYLLYPQRKVLRINGDFVMNNYLVSYYINNKTGTVNICWKCWKELHYQGSQRNIFLSTLKQCYKVLHLIKILFALFFINSIKLNATSITGPSNFESKSLTPSLKNPYLNLQSWITFCSWAREDENVYGWAFSNHAACRQLKYLTLVILITMSRKCYIIF